MTSIIGVLCKDGVVIGSDSAVTFDDGQQRTIEQKANKLSVIRNQIILAGTGQVGLGQRFHEVVNTHLCTTTINLGKIEAGKLIAKKAIEDFSSTGTERGQYGAILAYPDQFGVNLIEFSIRNMQPEWKNNSCWFVSLGCCQSITDSFLGFLRRVLFTNDLPNVPDGILCTAWTLKHVIAVNPGGINEPLQIAVIRKDRSDDKFKASLLDESDIQEHLENVDNAEEYIKGYLDIFHGSTSTELNDLKS